MNYELVTDANSEGFRQTLEIYRASFPDNERHTDDLVARRIAEGPYRLFVAKDGDNVAIFAILYDFPETEFVLLDYFASHPKMRGGGRGTEFFRHLVQSVSANGKSLVIEVEDPAYGNDEERHRRLKFYHRHGAREILSVPYKMPSLIGGEPIEMKLLLVPAASKRPLTGEKIRTLVRRLYEEVYNLNANDELMHSVLTKIPETVLVAA
jgi:GNAT superfamily N-acetyltransferase